MFLRCIETDRNLTSSLCDWVSGIRRHNNNPPGLSLRPRACRSLFVCDGRPSVTDGICSGRLAASVWTSARNQLRRFIHQSPQLRRQRSGAGPVKATKERQRLIGRSWSCYSHENNQFRRLHDDCPPSQSRHETETFEDEPQQWWLAWRSGTTLDCVCLHNIIYSRCYYWNCGRHIGKGRCKQPALMTFVYRSVCIAAQ